MNSEKPNKAAAIRKFMAENPGAKAKDIAAGAGCDITYVYLVQSADRRKGKPKIKKAPVDVTRGQEILRRELLDKDKTIAGMEKLLQEADERSQILAAENTNLHIIIRYLERKISGASV